MYFCNCSNPESLMQWKPKPTNWCFDCGHYCMWQDIEEGRTKPKRIRCEKIPRKKYKARKVM